MASIFDDLPGEDQAVEKRKQAAETQPEKQPEPEATQTFTEEVPVGVFGDEPKAEATIKTEPAQQPIAEKRESGPLATPRDVKLEGGFGTVPFGTVVERFPIPRMKFTQDQKEYLSMLSNDIMVFKLHFFEGGLGYVYCTGGTCCRVGGAPGVRYGIPMLKLDKGADGKPINPPSGTVVLPTIGQDYYDSLVDKAADHGDLRGKLLKVRCTDAEYQKIEFDVVKGDLASFPAGQQLLKDSLAYLAANKGSIKTMIAKTLKDSEIAESLDVQPDGSEVDEGSFFTG